MNCAGSQDDRRRRRVPRQRGGSHRENMAVAAQACGDDEHRRQHHDVKHHVFHNGDKRRRAQAAGVGVGGENDKGRNQRPLPAYAQGGNHLAHANQLQRDVRHGGKNAGNGHRDRKPTALITPAHVVSQGDVTVAVAYAPERGQHQHHDGIAHDAVRNGEEADGAGAEERGGNCNDGVRRVEVAANQEPGDQGAEAAPRQPPLIQIAQLRPSPAYGPEAGAGHQQETNTEDAKRYGLDGCRQVPMLT